MWAWHRYGERDIWHGDGVMYGVVYSAIYGVAYGMLYGMVCGMVYDVVYSMVYVYSTVWCMVYGAQCGAVSSTVRGALPRAGVGLGRSTEGGVIRCGRVSPLRLRSVRKRE